ncbi:MAG: formate--tetrahydrofolate ligase, partial [Syntrophomonadaceae bacterium]|nr:formate--tetrahydrofolate ligase [Syntrophomonadaceae bacterium]
MKSDVEIAQSAFLQPIEQVAERAGLLPEELELYGRYKAKVTPQAAERLQGAREGKLVLVTAINPTPAGEG